MTKKTQLPQEAQKTVQAYFNLPLNGKKVPCPYYINVRELRMGLRVLIGKGTPEEIIHESLIYEKLRNKDFKHMTIEQIRSFLVKRHIGIDCSGFVVHVLDKWLIRQGKKHLWKYLAFPKANVYRKIARFLRPVENISAAMLTNDTNTEPITNLNDTRAGDLIRAKGLKKRSFHIMLISDIHLENNKIQSFDYVHSTREYGKHHGVRKGKVIITDTNAPLTKQQWTDTYNNRNWTFEEICKDPEYSQVRRLTHVPLW